ncbi:alpha-2-macroglobulin [Legionella worsleiensis]|uniref:Alpha-2-macroglobulin n=1 Tax=Legionella worsleiensis TaxID=45076 RepID=A0A0W1A6H4_9GAMM|nr:alpha-2-macroglobulin [Legionella worsleiensis]KTD76983.1 hypothetical protein Lwor_2208 [Legionella worsleiensis]STY33345.1 Alpha-2-macroglobulin [Legionella worsleiensis]
MNKKPINSIVRFIASIFTSLFGTLNWNSPPWLLKIRQKKQKSPKVFWGLTLILITGICAVCYANYWYKTQFQPIYTSASIKTPDISKKENDFIPENLIIDFGIRTNAFNFQSVAPINMIGKTVTEGITINPAIAGEWMWESDSQLIFKPSQDWPAGQEYTIHFAQTFFAPGTKMEHYDVSFSTKPFAATLSDLRLYQDPVNSEHRTIEATVQFNFPVNPETLEKNTSVILQDTQQGTAQSVGRPIKFTYTLDEDKRTAYLHSEFIKIKKNTQLVQIILDKKIASSTNSAIIGTQLEYSLVIPDTSNFLKVLTASAEIIKNQQDKAEQVLTIETSLGVNEHEFNKSVHIYLLPLDRPANAIESAKTNYYWQNPGEVTPDILALATPLTKEAIPAEHNYSTLHSFKFVAQPTRFIYIKIDKGMKGFGDFTLKYDYTAVIPVPSFPKEISFLHKGSLLALSGEKKLSVLVRGVTAVKFDFARVLPDNINQLVTQTQGDFNNPYFINPNFSEQNISQIFSETQHFYSTDPSKQEYTALDLSKYLSFDTDTSGPKGLFLLKATEWNTTYNYALDANASRLILITDMGMIVKDNNDGTHDVFISSITQGTPVADATVTILGKNGLPILSRITNDQGRASFPSLKDFVADREPTVYLASLDNDVSFIPFNNYNRQLNFSKFNIGGIYTYNEDSQSLSAFVFSDRGIYRPGDTIHAGMIVKQTYAQSQPAGLPLQATVVDSRGTTVKEERLILNDSGYMELDFTTLATSPTGQYTINLYLVQDEHARNLLGSTSITVSEFQPDRMRIASNLTERNINGWISPDGLKAYVSLWNLYGAPATDRTIKAKILLTPQEINFSKYPDYRFVDPLFDPKKPPKVFTESLTDKITDDKGEAVFDLNLERYDQAAYKLTFFAEGFEANGGRSVTSQSQALISPLSFFIGYKPDGDLSFIKYESKRTIQYIAINPELTQEEVNDLKIQLISLHPVTTLVKKADGTYQYQSIIQSSVIKTEPFAISEQGTNYSLPTQQIGDYSLNVLDKENNILSQVKFTVAGSSQTPLARNAELSIKLNKDQYLANEDIEIQITSPYTGSGLITIERDKVYATQWFKTETPNSVQTIRIPADFQGNGYVNIAFVRDWDSPELFISPLSYGVVPFTVNHDDHDIKIKLDTPKVVKPGETLNIDYRTDKTGKIIVYAVDEGILQVGKYVTPNPLSFFFQKHALQVFTQQTVDQILPKFIQDREYSAAGGDDGEADLASRLNPFKRKNELPVVYWSGILDTDENIHHVSFKVPNYFNGSIKVMAVAVSNDSVGAADTSAEVRGDFIISPNVPTFVAPGDEFEISSSVANNIKNSGDHTPITVRVTPSPELEIIGEAEHTLEIRESHEQLVRFKVRAKSLLGAAKVTFVASAGDKTSTMNATLSVRPATPFFTQIQSGQSQNAKQTLDISQSLYPEYRTVDATVSTSPLIMVFGLKTYLDNYPYGCTEQLTSKALPLLAMNGKSWFNTNYDEINKGINSAIQMLSQRQMSNGGFSYWPDLMDNQGNNFSSVYAMHFLTEAKNQGINVPKEMFYSGINYLTELASRNVSTMDEARIQAYAIYILTRNEIVTTNYLANLQLYLQKDSTQAWKKDITAAYIAGSYQLLKSYNDASRLISQYSIHNNTYDNDFYNSAIADAQYYYIVAKHFPNLLPKIGNKLLMELVQAISSESINTVLSGYASLAVAAYPDGDSNDPSALTLSKVLLNNQTQLVPAEQTNYQNLSVDTNIKQINISNPKQLNYFYQLVQSGFDKTLSSSPTSQGIEIFREYRDDKGNVIQSTSMGNEIEVHIQIRALDNSYYTNIVIEDLLPGGFEVVRDSVKTDTMNFVDAREDRVNYFGSLDTTTKEIVYKIKAISAGTYTVPPAFAESMYNPRIKAQGTAAKITVTQ